MRELKGEILWSEWGIKEELGGGKKFFNYFLWVYTPLLPQKEPDYKEKSPLRPKQPTFQQAEISINRLLQMQQLL